MLLEGRLRFGVESMTRQGGNLQLRQERITDECIPTPEGRKVLSPPPPPPHLSTSQVDVPRKHSFVFTEKPSSLSVMTSIQRGVFPSSSTSTNASAQKLASQCVMMSKIPKNFTKANLP
mmetsp:Transcript_30065/g.64935  ORF Transcript_30065/g.64935 Transcript_30065/m.64935 type:complete len:119 (-) Transcript_30065:1469-1825(-)